MTFHKQNQSWLIGLGVMLTLLWTSQFASDWFRPHNEIEFAQHSKIELANTIESEWSGASRASRLESKSDPVALTIDPAELTLPTGRQWRKPFTLIADVGKQSLSLPGIRAPPRYTLSA